MDQQRLLFEQSPLLVLLCLGVGLLYAYVLYQKKQSWGAGTTKLLFAIRTILVFFISFLLLGPILKLTLNNFEKPAIAFLIDDSSSIREATDSTQRNNIYDAVEKNIAVIESGGYKVDLKTLSNSTNITFDHPTSDLSSAVRDLIGEYEGKNLAGLVVLSDGIFNSGSSPLYSSSRIPVYTVGMGDTTERVDIMLRNVLYNKIAYEGNKFPLRAEVLAKGVMDGEIMVSVFEKGRLIARDARRLDKKSILEFDFQIDAAEKGLHRFDVSVQPLNQERNKKNNYASAYVEVVEGKKKILLVAPAPHPDIKAIRSVVERNSNYDLIVHMLGVKEASAEQLRNENVDLAIFHQVLDYSGKTSLLFNSLMEGGTPMLVTLGERSNLRQLAARGIPITFENPGQWDAITPVVNSEFRDFSFSENLNSIFSRYPPVNVPFGKFTYPANANTLLFQRIGRVETDRPFILTTMIESKRMGIILGEGIWRWRMDEYAETQKTDAFDEVFSKLIQYLSTKDDKRKFRCFPIQNEFTASEPVVFESQVYNELFEQIYGNKVDITLTNEAGGNLQYSYVTSPGSTRYRIGGLPEGVYKYRATTTLNEVSEVVSGEFLISEQNIEAQNLTADFNLLRRWADNTGGKFYTVENLSSLSSDLSQNEAKSIIHSEESFNPLINLKLVFFFLLALISAEWFTRKYMGGY